MRIKRISTVSFLIEETKHTIKDNIDKSIHYLEKAAEESVDILCFPEALLSHNTDETASMPDGVFPVEEFPGKITKLFCQKAKQKKMCLIVPNYLSEKGKIYNQATFIDKKGKITGYYRKVQPTYTETFSVTPGNELKVFELDSVKIGAMICLDIYFPEIPRIYAFKGAEIIFWPTLTHGPTQVGLEAQMRARAIDNSLYIAQANIAGNPPYAPYSNRYRPGKSNIMDYNGDIIADTGRKDGICFADIDFDQPRITSGIIGIREPDILRTDLESITRMDWFAKEYQEITKNQKRNKRYFGKCL
jgi:predicted amidohydrolase